nr:MAG TPA: hypothetical protein [Caudoviricetes sp.]
MMSCLVSRRLIPLLRMSVRMVRIIMCLRLMLRRVVGRIWCLDWLVLPVLSRVL